MDYNKIGNFILAARKEKNLTQAKLAEKIFVSEKTISKWENGKGIPDATSLSRLSELFEVSVNELLAGERGSKNDKQQDEKLLLNMVKEINEKNKIIWTSMWLIMGVNFIALLAGLLITVFFVPEGIWQLVSVISLVIVFLLPCFYALKLEVSVGSYKCKKCGCEIVPTYKEALNAMHMGTTRYLKCPKCKKRTWCKKNIKK